MILLYNSYDAAYNDFDTTNYIDTDVDTDAVPHDNNDNSDHAMSSFWQ